MSKRNCTETRPCQLATCYACRRALIDRTAEAMLNSGLDPQAVDQYRYGSINALAFEIPATPPKPQPKARKGFTPKAGVDYQAMADKLRVCGSREYAAQLLAGRTIPELRHIAQLLGLVLPGRLKADVLSSLIHYAVGVRLDQATIRNYAKR